MIEGVDAARHRHAGRGQLRRHPRPVRDRVRLHPAARLRPAAPDQADQQVQALPPGTGDSRRLPAAGAGADPADPLGPDRPAVRPDDQVRHRDPAGHRLHRGDPAPVHPRRPQHPTYDAMLEARPRAARPSSSPATCATATCNARSTKGCNVVESWNRANDVIFYGKGGDLATNRRDEQELGRARACTCCRPPWSTSTPCMLQDVLADRTGPAGSPTRTAAALTPLFWTHVAPYGEVRLRPGPPPRPRPAVPKPHERDAGSRGPPAEPPTDPGTASAPRRTPAKRKARQLAKYLRDERPDYAYLKEVFRHLRAELGVEVDREPKTLPYVPTEDEIRRYYQVVWKGPPDRRRRAHQDPALHRRPRRRTRRHPPRRRRPRRLPHPHHPAAKAARTAPSPSPPPSKRPSPCTSQARRRAARRPPVRVHLEEALQHPRRTRHARPLRRCRRHDPTDQPPPAPALPVHLAQDPRHRRRPHPALQRPRQPQIAGDLLQIALGPAQDTYESVIDRFPV